MGPGPGLRVVRAPLSATAAERLPAVGSPAHGPDAPRRQRWHLERGASSGAWKGCPAHVSAEPVGALFGRGLYAARKQIARPGPGRSPVMAGRPAGLLPKRLWLASVHDCEPGACRGQLITPDRDKDDVVFHRWHPALRRFPRRPAPAEYIAGGKASSGHFISPRPVAQHRDRAPRCHDVRPVDVSDQPRPDSAVHRPRACDCVTSRPAWASPTAAPTASSPTCPQPGALSSRKTAAVTATRSRRTTRCQKSSARNLPSAKSWLS